LGDLLLIIFKEDGGVRFSQDVVREDTKLTFYVYPAIFLSFQTNIEIFRGARAWARVFYGVARACSFLRILLWKVCFFLFSNMSWYV